MSQVSTIQVKCVDCGVLFDAPKTAGRPRSKCDDCKKKRKNQSQANWRNANRSRLRQLHAEWRGRNRDRINESRREDYWANPEQSRERSRQSVSAHRKNSPEAWAATQARHFTPSNKRRHNLRRNYNMTPEDYDLMLERQNGCCKICGTSDPQTRSKRFCIDHCHSTGAVRGLLCNSCNLGLGAFKDDAGNLEKAIAYLDASQVGAAP